MADLEMTEDNFSKLQADNTKMIQDAANNTAMVNDLKASVEGLENKSRELLGKLADGKKTAEEERLTAAKTSGDIEAIENSWKDKLSDSDKRYTDNDSKWEKAFNDVTIKREALAMAVDIAMDGSAEALTGLIEKRMVNEFQEDGSYKTRILDKDGKPSAMTKDDLVTEIYELKAWAPLLKGSQANGSGEVHTRGVKDTSKTIKRDAFNALTSVEQNSLITDGVVPTD